ncbi:hypothetical protein MNBD_PLANCTO03-2028 [hydrothermal vent metagenome]|uniref:PEP-CTERM protein-sorting domain-containing protein n=1 Tax=hydrothermal vent metagenome TaxID=652676 RepID=A0A3B1D2U9_9ZZZZ
MTRNTLCMTGILAVLGMAGLAQADQILYANNFQSRAIGSEWSSNSLLSNGEDGEVFTRFNGRYTNEATVLTLTAVSNPGGIGGGDNNDGGSDNDNGDGGGGGGQRIVYTLEFDFYAIDSWDGNNTSYGPDTFEVLRNSEILFSETFANTHMGQSFRRPDIGPEALGFSPAWADSVYRDITVSFEIPEGDETFTLSFRGLGLQSMIDESWGIDNVQVSYSVVPAPATLSAGGLLLLLSTRRRRS